MTELTQELRGAVKELVRVYFHEYMSSKKEHSERTIAGLQRAKAQGRIGGRPRLICDRTEVFELRRSGLSLGKIAAQLRLSKSSVARIVKGSQEIE